MTKPPAGPVAPEWLVQQDKKDKNPKVIWLSNAWETFGASDHVDRARLAAKRFSDLREGETPEMHLMSSGVEFPQWRKARRIPRDEVQNAFKEYCIYRDAAEADVDTRLHFGTLFAFGDPQHPGADPVWIPIRAWFWLKRDPDQQDVVRGDNLVYYYVRIVEAKAAAEAAIAAEHVPDHALIQSVEKKKRPPPARRDFVAADKPLIEEMHQMLTAKPPRAKDKQEAASLVVDRAAGHGTVQSKMKRLMKHYSDVYG